MLVSFSVENFMSIADSAKLTMVASKERQHGERVAHIPKYTFRLLPVAAIYGGNASGKTNLFRAISFAKRFIVTGTQLDASIPVEPYSLNDSKKDASSTFCFEILVNKQVYEFGFSLDKLRVQTEWLTLIKTKEEKVLYRRTGDSLEYSDPSLFSDQALQFAFNGTRANQLFLTNAVLQKITAFRPIYMWFRDTLELIAPDSRFQAFNQFLTEDAPLQTRMNNAIALLDTGIARIGGEEMPLDQIPALDDLKERLLENLPLGQSANLEYNENRIQISKTENGLVARRLSGYHLNEHDHEIKIEFRFESDGTRRVIDLLPAFLALEETKAQPKVYLVDELDRSLHTLLTRGLIEGYLATRTTEAKGQLIFTTHDVQLMDQELFRRDEMWILERKPSGRSVLTAFSEFSDVRYDKDIRKSYLQGRLGGIPRLPSKIRVVRA